MFSIVHMHVYMYKTHFRTISNSTLAKINQINQNIILCRSPPGWAVLSICPTDFLRVLPTAS